MRITVLAVGSRMPGWVSEGVAEYQKRLPRHIELVFTEIPSAQKTSGARAHVDKESEQLLKKIPAAARVIALDERGSQWTSVELGKQMESWLADYPQVALLVGGADGLSAAARERADQLWSLSSLTLPHALVRVVLAEQLYRAWTLVQGHPYHRE